MTRICVRALLVLALLLAALPWRSSPALAVPPPILHQLIAGYAPQTVDGACTFPVRQDILEGTRETLTVHVDQNGNPTRQ